MKRKKLLVVLLILLCCFLVGCTKKETKKEIKEEKKVEEKKQEKKEEWSLDVENSQQMLNDDIIKVFNESEEKLEPIALLGEQVVSGTNYMFFTKKEEEGKKEYKIAIIYKNLQGEIKITSIKDFNVEKYANKDIELDTEETTGGWITNIPGKPIMLDQKTQNYFDKATSELTDMNYFPISVLAKQEKTSTNYAILCFGNSFNKNQITEIFILTINVDEEDTAKIISSKAVNLNDFNQ